MPKSLPAQLLLHLILRWMDKTHARHQLASGLRKYSIRVSSTGADRRGVGPQYDFLDPSFPKIFSQGPCAKLQKEIQGVSTTQGHPTKRRRSDSPDWIPLCQGIGAMKLLCWIPLDRKLGKGHLQLPIQQKSLDAPRWSSCCFFGCQLPGLRLSRETERMLQWFRRSLTRDLKPFQVRIRRAIPPLKATKYLDIPGFHFMNDSNLPRFSCTLLRWASEGFIPRHLVTPQKKTG